MPAPDSARRRIRVAFCLGLVGLAMGPVAAGWAGPAGEESSMRGLFVGGEQRGPITIDARRFEADNKRRTATYIDHVVAKQDDTTLTADRLTVSYDERRQISQVTAEGSVRIVVKGAAGQGAAGQGAAGPGSTGSGQPAPDREALCSRVVFQVAEDRIVCTGAPATLRQGEDVIRGPRITVQVGEERIVVEGDGQVPRVTSRITPRDQLRPPPGAGTPGPRAGGEPSGSRAGSALPN